MCLYAAIPSIAGKYCVLSCAQEADWCMCCRSSLRAISPDCSTGTQKKSKLPMWARSYSDGHAAALCFFFIVSALYQHQFLSVRKSPNRALLIQLHKELVLDQVMFNHDVNEEPMESGSQVFDSMLLLSFQRKQYNKGKYSQTEMALQETELE